MEAAHNLALRREPGEAPVEQPDLAPFRPQEAAATTHRIGIFNVKYSPNLGDGIIAECLEGELRRADPRVEPVSIDLAGRTGFDPAHGNRRAAMLAVIERLPSPLRARIVPAMLLALVRLRMAPRWRAQLKHCDSVIVGGGALFQDVDQNFPVKISEALKLANARGLPVAVASVGVSGQWSRAGRRRLAARLLAARTVSLSVRDTQSASTWRAVMGTLGIGAVAHAPDPGLLTSRHYGPAPRPDTTSRRIGICVTAPIALRLHHDDGHDDRQLETWMVAVARELAALGNEVMLFTNGSPEDRLFRDRLKTVLADDAAIRFAPDFARPQELAHTLAGFDCVLAHRLHACIVAYSYRVPTVGFAWDGKLRSFFEQTRRGHFVIDPREASPLHVADLAMTAMAQGIDEATHAHLQETAKGAIHALAQRLLAGSGTAGAAAGRMGNGVRTG